MFAPSRAAAYARYSQALRMKQPQTGSAPPGASSQPSRQPAGGGYRWVAPPPRSALQQLVDHFEAQFQHYSPTAGFARWLTGKMGLNSAYDLAEAQKRAAQTHRPAPTLQAIKAANAARLAAQEREWRATRAMRDAADPARRPNGSRAGNAVRAASALAGDAVGSMLGDPSSFVAPGRKLATKLIGQALLGAGFDLGLQQYEVREGTRSSWDPAQTGISMLAGPTAILGTRAIGRGMPIAVEQARRVGHRFLGDAQWQRRARPAPASEPRGLDAIDPARISYGHKFDDAGLVLVDGQPWKPQGLGYASVAYRVPLSPEQLGRSPPTHRRIASAALRAQLFADRDELASFKSMIPDIEEAVANPAGPKTPQYWIWHHDFQDAAMDLIPQRQHIGREFQDLLHPDGKGGYARLAVPAGAPPRRKRKRR